MPVISIGGTLNARMYETPITVPGIANDSIVPNSNSDWPDELLPCQQVGGEDAERRGERRARSPTASPSSRTSSTPRRPR